ncbi:MAG TPA: hypothetical protein H9995_08750 [Candidatus Alistipes excrementigallinarum]|nr:hypothetical protein [Candidatus Alistipes excrementigallinarum]
MNKQENKQQPCDPCDPCERNFERNIHHIVREGEAPTERERERKEQELREAFGEKHPEAVK